MGYQLDGSISEYEQMCQEIAELRAKVEAHENTIATYRRITAGALCGELDESTLKPLQPKEVRSVQISQQSEVSTDWSDGVKSMRLICRENDLVVVDAPPTSRAAEYNGVEGVITAFEDEWIMVNVNGVSRRFRYDELKIL